MRAELIAVAKNQHGVWSRAQARQVGYSPKAIDKEVGAGRWVVVQPRVYAAPSTPIVGLTALWAAYLSVGAPAAAAGRSAAALRRFKNCEHPAVPEIAVPADRRPRGLRDCAVTELDPFPNALPTVEGLPVLDRALSVRTLAAVTPYADLLDIVQELVRTDRVTLELLSGVLGRGRKGSERLRQVCEELAPGGDSAPERRLWRALHRAGLVEWQLGHEVVADGHAYDLDLWHAPLRFGIEVDGVGSHLPLRRFRGDRWRNNRLTVRSDVALSHYAAYDVEHFLADVIKDVTESMAEVERRRAREGRLVDQPAAASTPSAALTVDHPAGAECAGTEGQAS